MAPRRATFAITFAEPVELVGHVRAVLHVSAEEAEDVDVFVALFKLDAQGDQVGFSTTGISRTGRWRSAGCAPRTASSTGSVPPTSSPCWRTGGHCRPPPGEPTRLDVEVWPSGTRFEAGQQLLLVVRGSDVMRYREPLTYARHTGTVNVGRSVVHTGGGFDSHLVVPVLPTRG